MWPELLAVAGGFLLLTWSADRFVVGAASVAYNLNVSPLIIGLTIVSLGTSAPEMLVSAMAAWQGNSGLSVGNAIGSNIINIALVLGLTALIAPLDIHSSILRRELPVLIVIMSITWLLLTDHDLGRLDGSLLLGGMVLMLVELVVPSFTIFWFGLGGLVVGGAMLLFSGLPFVGQVLLWVVASTGFVLLWFKVLKPKMKDRTMAGIST